MAIPLDVLLTIRRTSSWNERDYVYAWFVKIYIQAALSTDPGYLDVRDEDIWKLAGSHKKEFFDRHRGPEMVREQFRRSADGRLYSPEIIEALPPRSRKVMATVAQSVRQSMEVPF